jgi:hypothetical protein
MKHSSQIDNYLRHTSITLLFFFVVFSCEAQDSPDHLQSAKASYVKRYKDQRTGGFVLCAAGLGGLLGTAIADAGQRTGGVIVTLISLGTYEPENKSYTGAYIVSGAFFISGLYLYTAAAKNKRKWKAASITMGMERTEMLKYNVFCKQSFPTVGLKIKI